MAGGILYSIQLQLRVDDSQLDAAIAKLNTLKRSAKDTYVRVGAGVGGNTPRSPRGSGGGRDVPRWTMSDRLRDLTNWRFSRAGWQNGLDVFNKRVKTFQDSFFNNLSSLSGLRYNAVNLGKVFTSLGGAVGKAIPAIGALTQGAMMAGKIWVGVHGWRLASAGLPLFVGTKMLNSNSMSEAASNLMQMRMAEKGLGGNYQSTLNRATQLAAEYGFSRVGMLNAMNMFTGLNVDGKKLTPEDASHLAEVIGKIAHVGGLSFERVNVNLQQLLGQAVPSLRDIRELVGQAPFISKLAMNMMDERGLSGDYRDWLKNKSNLRAVLDEFNELVESHPVMKARGEIALAKENFWISLADRLSPYWDKIAKANEKLYGWLGDKIVSWVSNIDPEALGHKLDSIVTELNKFANALSGIANIISGVVSGFSFGPHGAWSYNYKTKRLEKTTIIGTSDDAAERTAQSNRNAAFSTYLDNIDPVIEQLAWDSKITGKEFDKVKAYELFNTPDFINKFTSDLSNFQWTPTKWSLIPSFTGIGPNMVMEDKSDPTEYKTSFSKKGLEFLLNALSGESNASKYQDVFGNSAAEGQQQLADLSKGSKSIFINFNREIVKMDVNIASVGDIDELGRKLEPKIEEVVVRGLTIALNNATSAT